MEKKMKKAFIILSVIATISLLGCSETEVTSELSELVSETVDNEESENLTGEATGSDESEVLPEETTGSEENEISTEETAGNVEAQLTLELKGTDNPRIDELLNVSGTYTDIVGNVNQYVYQIPQFHADSESAKTVNERIVEDIYDNIYDEIVSMEGGYSLFCYSFTYEVVTYGDIVAIIISAPYPNDCVQYYAYSYDFGQDKEVTNAEMLAMYDWTDDAFIEEACRREKEYFKRQISDIYPDMTEEDVDYYIQSAIYETTVDLPMYIGTDGILYVYLPMPSVAGAEWYYGLEQF